MPVSELYAPSVCPITDFPIGCKSSLGCSGFLPRGKRHLVLVPRPDAVSVYSFFTSFTVTSPVFLAVTKFRLRTVTLTIKGRITNLLISVSPAFSYSDFQVPYNPSIVVVRKVFPLRSWMYRSPAPPGDQVFSSVIGYSRVLSVFVTCPLSCGVWYRSPLSCSLGYVLSVSNVWLC